MEASALLSAAERAVGFGAWHWDLRQDVLRWSEGLYRLFGLDPGSVEASFERFLERVHPEDRARIEAAGRAAIDEQRLSVNEYRVVRPDGEVRFVRGTSEAVRDDAGETVAMLGTLQDITERRAMEAELEQKAAAQAVAEQTRAIQRVLALALTHETVDELLPELLRPILGLLNVDDAAILLMSPDGRALTIAATEGVEDGQVGTIVPVGAGLAGRAAAERRPVILTGPEIATVVNPALRHGGFSALAAVPMISGTEVIGVLRVATRRKRGLDDAEMTLLRITADRAALGIRRVDLFDRERSIARKLQDGLAAAVPTAGSWPRLRRPFPGGGRRRRRRRRLLRRVRESGRQLHNSRRRRQRQGPGSGRRHIDGASHTAGRGAA